MPTKKVVKKVVAKKSTKKTVAARVPASEKATTVPAVAIAEVFTTRPESQRTVEVPPHSVLLFVNGRDKGVTDTSNQTLGKFAVQHAQNAGITSFSLYVDGVKADTGDKDKSMSGMHKVELVSKDARG